jgi:hypothetical protein
LDGFIHFPILDLLELEMNTRRITDDRPRSPFSGKKSRYSAGYSDKITDLTDDCRIAGYSLLDDGFDERKSKEAREALFTKPPPIPKPVNTILNQLLDEVTKAESLLLIGSYFKSFTWPPRSSQFKQKLEDEIEYCIKYNKDRMESSQVEREKIAKILFIIQKETIDLSDWGPLITQTKFTSANITPIDIQEFIVGVGRKFDIPALENIFDFVGETTRDSMTMNPKNFTGSSSATSTYLQSTTGSSGFDSNRHDHQFGGLYPKVGWSDHNYLQSKKKEAVLPDKEVLETLLNTIKESVQNSCQETIERNMCHLYNEMVSFNNQNAQSDSLRRLHVVKSTGPFKTSWSKYQDLQMNGSKPTAAPIGSLPSQYNIWYPQNTNQIKTMNNTQANELVCFYGLSYPNNLSFGGSDQHLAAKISAIHNHLCQ